MGEGDWTLRAVKAHEEGCGTVQIVCREQEIPGVAE
jgi:hypothetical protein